jgi:hypothetical protein
MKTALVAVVATSLCAVWSPGNANAQAEHQTHQAEPTPAPGSATQFPGIIVTPPRAPPADAQQSCPDTGRTLELVG